MSDETIQTAFLPWSGRVDRLWEGYHESKRCSRDTYPESYLTNFTSVRRLGLNIWVCSLHRKPLCCPLCGTRVWDFWIRSRVRNTHILMLLLCHSQAYSGVIQKSMRLEYKPPTEPHIPIQTASLVNPEQKNWGSGCRVSNLGFRV